MYVHHTKIKQAMDIGCYISETGGRYRIFWPQRAVELFGTTVDEALSEMRAVQNILHTYPDYRVVVNGGCLVGVVNEVTDKELAGVPKNPTWVWALIEAGEDEWIPMNDRPPEPPKDPTHIGGVARDGAKAYKEGTPVTDCPYPEESTEFSHWNEDWDEAADQAEEENRLAKSEGVGSVITNRYRAKYAELGHPTHCGDELAGLLNSICNNKAGTNLELFETICSANNVSLAKYSRTSKGWQGRLRMTGRNLLAKRVREQGGKLMMPTGFAPEHYQLSEDWLFNAERKYKPKVDR